MPMRMKRTIRITAIVTFCLAMLIEFGFGGRKYKVKVRL